MQMKDTFNDIRRGTSMSLIHSDSRHTIKVTIEEYYSSILSVDLDHTMVKELYDYLDLILKDWSEE